MQLSPLFSPLQALAGGTCSTFSRISSFQPMTSVLTAACSTMLVHGVLAVGYSTFLVYGASPCRWLRHSPGVPTGVLTATCESGPVHGDLAVGYGTLRAGSDVDFESAAGLETVPSFPSGQTGLTAMCGSKLDHGVLTVDDSSSCWSCAHSNMRYEGLTAACHDTCSQQRASRSLTMTSLLSVARWGICGRICTAGSTDSRSAQTV